MTGRYVSSLVVLIAVIVVAVILAGCGSSTASPQTGFVNTAVSDPPTCSAPNGPYQHVWVTVTEVEIHNSGSGQWTNLTPNLQPTQVDLLAPASTECFLAMLGSKTELQAGSYEQIRIHLADNSVKLEKNQCGNGNNAALHCVVLSQANGGGTFALQLSSEDKNGIKIPSGQIAGGQFTIAAGETKDLDIDFDACASIVVQGNGQYRLKPVLHAGEVEFSSAINGRILDANTSQAVVGGTTVVALESRDNAGIDRVVMSTTTDSTGGFALCPVPTGTYDLVAVAIDGSGKAYGATVVTGVTAGKAMGDILLFPTTGLNTTFATITGHALTQGNSGEVPEDVNLSALQAVSLQNQAFTITVPLANQSVATASVTTVVSSCDPSSACVVFSFELPALNPHVAAFGSALGSAASYTLGGGSTGYVADARTLPLGTPVCSSLAAKSAFVAVSPGSSPSAGDLSFTGCVLQ